MKIITRYQNLIWRIADIISFDHGNNGDKIEKIRAAIDKKPTMYEVDEAIEEYIALKKESGDDSQAQKSKKVQFQFDETSKMTLKEMERRGIDKPPIFGKTQDEENKVIRASVCLGEVANSILGYTGPHVDIVQITKTILDKVGVIYK